MAESIRERLQTHSPRVEVAELRKLLEAAQADLAALRASIVAITAKLDADAGVTDTNYAATTNPAALTMTT
jgi:hypothetical protein